MDLGLLPSSDVGPGRVEDRRDAQQLHRRAVEVAVAALREGRSWLEAADAAEAVLH